MLSSVFGLSFVLFVFWVRPLGGLWNEGERSEPSETTRQGADGATRGRPFGYCTHTTFPCCTRFPLLLSLLGQGTEAGAPMQGAPASVPCPSKESKRGKRVQHGNVVWVQYPKGRPRVAPSAPWRVVSLGSLRSPSFHNPPRGRTQKTNSTNDKPNTEDNI